jgi:hypothetical protein
MTSSDIDNVFNLLQNLQANKYLQTFPCNMTGGQSNFFTQR